VIEIAAPLEAGGAPFLRMTQLGATSMLAPSRGMRISTRFSSALALVAALAFAACTVDDPHVIVPPDRDQGTGPFFADVILGISVGSTTTSCITGGVPVCGTDAPQTGMCADNPALGPPDGNTFDIMPLGRLELGFLCNTIREVGGTMLSNDFVIHGSVEGTVQPIVEVSIDGSSYVAVNYWPRPMPNGPFLTDPGFQLEVPMWSAARFVRISLGAGTGVIHVDAVEALSP